MQPGGRTRIAAGEWIDRMYLDVLEAVLRHDFRRARPAFDELAVEVRARLVDRRGAAARGAPDHADGDRRSGLAASLHAVLGSARASLARLDGAAGCAACEVRQLDALEALVRVRRVLAGCVERPASRRLDSDVAVDSSWRITPHCRWGACERVRAVSRRLPRPDPPARCRVPAATGPARCRLSPPRAVARARRPGESLRRRRRPLRDTPC